MTTEQTGLTGGQLLALGDEHQRGLHRAAVSDCTRCVLEGLFRSADAPVDAETSRVELPRFRASALVVDDSGDMRDLLRDVLEPGGVLEA